MAQFMNEQDVYSFNEALMRRLKAQFKRGTKLMLRVDGETCAVDVDWVVDTFLSLSKEAQFVAAEVAQACTTKLPGGCSDLNYLCEISLLLKKAEGDGMLPQ